MSREQQTKCPQCGSFQRPTPLTAFDAPLVTCGHSWHLVEPTPPATPQPGTKACGHRGPCECAHYIDPTRRALSPPPDVERLEVLVYQIEGGGPFDATDVRLERRKNREGISRWAVVNRSCVLNKEGEWEWEPIPSSRTDEYLARTRFDTPSDALAAFRALSPSTPGEPT